ncbi:MAG: hypothetical protein LAN71_09810 [Acidobacteriia bacterium]|nr:hypothetical protein [Terriglobia bacterium]
MIRRANAVLAVLALLANLALAGGPMVVTGPAALAPGKPFVWDVATPIQFTVDGGPMSKSPTGTVVVDHATGLARVKAMFQVWQSVPTTAISFSYAGALTASGLSADGDVDTLAEYNASQTTCKNGTQSPIVFDADGSILKSLGLDPLVIGFAGLCKVDPQAGHILSAHVLLNGRFQDGVTNSTTSNYELTADEFDEAITHEIGHFAGLDHSQINTSVFNQSPGNCNLDDLAGLPLMFPVDYCQARKSAGLPVLAPDDVAWISSLYPNAGYPSAYGTISGFIYFSDGITQVQGLNVIARFLDNPNTVQDESKRVAVSVVSGYLFTGNPGQSITTTNPGSPYGSRSPALIGYYEIPVPPGTYTVQTENIDARFVGGSSVGPLDRPAITYGAYEFWHHNESAFDDPSLKDPIVVSAGQTVNGIDFILNSTPPRFDKYEDGMAFLPSHPAGLFAFRRSAFLLLRRGS